MKYLVTDIDYDTNNTTDLPSELTITVPKEEAGSPFEIEMYLCDEISNITGFCHKGFSFQPIKDK